MHQQLARKALGPVAVAAIAFAVVLEAVGVYGDRSGDPHATREFLVVVVMITVAAAAVFGWVVPHYLARESVATAALVLSIAGLLSIALFWTGLPPILAGAGALLGWAGRDAPRRAGRAGPRWPSESSRSLRTSPCSLST